MLVQCENIIDLEFVVKCGVQNLIRSLSLWLGIFWYFSTTKSFNIR